MGGTFSVGGLITGLNTNEIIAQLMQIERRPIIRIQERIARLESQRDAIRTLRTELTTLRSRAQDFRLGLVFDRFSATSSETTVLATEVSGPSPVVGSYAVNVTQLANATVATSSSKLGASINPGVALNSSGINPDVTSGTFTINGVSFTVDPATDSLNTILSNINASAASVTATYNAVTDKVTFENSTPGNTSLINLGATADTSNFLTALNVVGATQTTGGAGSTTVTSTRNLGAVNASDILNTVSFASGTATSGTFSINGISISVDATTDTLADVLARINDSDAQVTASYDSSSDTIRVVSDTLGSRTVQFTAGTSNFLTVTNLTAATQDAGDDAQFTINGGSTQTRNTNQVSDAIGDVTLNFLSTGTSTVTVEGDDDTIVERVNDFVTAFNNAITQIETLTGRNGVLGGDGSLQVIENYLRDTIFSQVSGITGDFASLVDIGITTGTAFDAEAITQLQLDETEFREALRTDRLNVRDLFTNTGETGVADLFSDYLNEVTTVTGFLNDRVKTRGSIDSQILLYNDRILRLEDRVEKRELRLRAQFTRLEQLSAGFQSQNSTLSSLILNFRQF